MERRLKINKFKVKKYAAYLVYALISGFIIASGLSLFVVHYNADILTINSVKEINLTYLFCEMVFCAVELFVLFVKRNKL